MMITLLHGTTTKLWPADPFKTRSEILCADSLFF